MINTVTLSTKDDFGGPRRNYAWPTDYTGNEDKKMTERQQKLLTDLIFQRIGSSDERERYLSQINDGLSSVDAEDLVFSFLTSKWS